MLTSVLRSSLLRRQLQNGIYSCNRCINRSSTHLTTPEEEIFDVMYPEKQKNVPLNAEEYKKELIFVKKSRNKTQNIKKHTGVPIIKCKRPEFNHYRGENYGKFDVVPLASNGWNRSKAKGDYFTIDACPDMVTDGNTALSLINDEDDDCDDDDADADQQSAGQFFEVLIKQETHWEQDAEDGSEEQNSSILSSGIQNLEKGLTKHTGEKRFRCEHCDYKAFHRSHFVVHLRTHTKEKPFSCEFCNYAGADAGRLRVHMRKHTGEKPYSCEICDFKCSQLSNLKSHRRTHSDKKDFNCELCDYTCTRSCRLKNHLYKKHNVGVERFSCEFCEYSSLQSTDLKLHLRTHTGEKPFSCEFCAFKCSRLGNLKDHLKKHTGEKPFICELCDFSSAYSSALQKHQQRYHKGENPISCKFCSYTCSKPRNLKEHLRTQHKDEYTFNCNN